MTWRQHPNNFDNPINPEYEQEARLVEQARAGSERAFSALLARYQQPVFRLIYHLVGDLDEARDLTRIALRHALVRMPRVPSGYSIRPWLLRVATLVALDAVRERSESPQALLSSLHLPPAPSPDGPRIVDSDPTMADTMLLSIAELEDQPEIAIANAWDRLPLDIERELIRRLLASLPEGDAELLALGVVGQVPTRDLAAIAGTSQRSIRRRIARALIMFQSQYQAIRTDALPPAPATKELPAASISGITAIDVARRGFAEASDRVKRGIRTVRANFSSEDAQERLETLRGDQTPPTPGPTPTTPTPAVGTGGARSQPTPSASTPGGQIARNVVPSTQRPDVTRPMPVMNDSAPPTPTQETIIVAAAHVEPTAPVPEWTTPVPTLDDLAFATKAHAFGTADEHNRATTEATESMPLDTSATVARLESLRDVAPDATVILSPAPVEMVAEQTMILRTPMGDPIHTRQLPRFGPPSMANDALADVVVPVAASSASGASPQQMTHENDEQIPDETMILAVASSPTQESIPEAAVAEPEAVPANTASDFERNALPVDAESPLGEAEIAAMAEDLAAVALDDAAINNLSTVYVVPAELIELSDDDMPDMPNQETLVAVVDAPTERREIAATLPDDDQPLTITYYAEHVPAAEIEHTAIFDATEHTALADVTEHVSIADAAEHEAIADATEHTTDVPMIAFVAANVVADESVPLAEHVVESVPLAEHSPESIPLDSALFGDAPSVDEIASAVDVPPTFVAENSVAAPVVASAEESSPVDAVPNPDVAPNVLMASDAENALIFVDATPTMVFVQPPSAVESVELADTMPDAHDIPDEMAAEHFDLLTAPDVLQQTAPRGATTEHGETPITAPRIDPMAEQQSKAEAREPLSEEPNVVAMTDATVLDATTDIDTTTPTTMTDDLVHDDHVVSEAATDEQVTSEANTSVQATPEVATNEHVTPETNTNVQEMPEVAVSEQEALVDHTTSDEGLAATSPSVAPAGMPVVTAEAAELHTEQAAANIDEPTSAAMLADSDEASHSKDTVDPVVEVQQPAPTVIVRRADDTVVVNDTARQQYIERHRIVNVDMGDLNGITGITLDPQGELPEEAATPEKLPAHGISVVSMPVETPTAETSQPASHDLADLAGLVPTTHADFAATTPEHDTLPPPTQRSRRPTRPMPHIDRDVADSAHDW